MPALRSGVQTSSLFFVFFAHLTFLKEILQINLQHVQEDLPFENNVAFALRVYVFAEQFFLFSNLYPPLFVFLHH